jgi:hypothetical protein
MNPSIDRLYQLLPAIHRFREAEIAGRLQKGEAGFYIRDLLRVISEQVNAVEDDMAQLYDDWFIETASDWVVPYIADLIGYEAVAAAGDPGASSGQENRILIPRQDVANTIRYRRRRGTASVLRDLAMAVSGWPAIPMEFYRLLGWTQNLNHQYLSGHRARVASLRDANELDKIGGPFDPFAHSVDVRRISSEVSQGCYNIPSIGAEVWRLKPYSVTRTAANCLDAGKNTYTFSVLGNDAPLYTHPDPRCRSNLELTVPARIRRRGFDADKNSYYGVDKSFSIYADWAGYTSDKPVKASAIIPANLSGWAYAPPDDFIAVDPELGRIAFPQNQLPDRSVRVCYYYAFSDDTGGGEYDRVLTQPADFVLYTVGESGVFKKINDALAAWRAASPAHAVIEVSDSGVYAEQIEIEIAEDRSLQLRAANATRPILRMLDWQTDRPDSLSVKMSQGSRFTLDGFLVTGRGLSITASKLPTRNRDPKAVMNRCDNPRNEICPAAVVIRHCTLVPGWTLDCDCQPMTPNKESLELRNVRAKVTIERSILGPIEVQEDEVNTDPIPIEISDCLIDGMDGDHAAIIGPSDRHAHATLCIRRSTVFGVVQTHAVTLAENSIFYDCVHVARRQIGCMRFCYVPADCRTPKRYNCQPDLVIQAEREKLKGQSAVDILAGVARAAARVRPQFTARRYGNPAYCQLSGSCAAEILRGADDASEMGVFHDLFQPQRLENLRARLEQYTPAGLTSGVLLTN